MAKENSVSFAKFSSEVQQIFLKQYSDVLVKTGDSYEFAEGKAPRFQDFSDEVKNQLKIESEVRKKQALAEKLQQEQAKADLQKRKELETKLNAFKAEHFLSFGTLPSESESAVFVSMVEDRGKSLTEKDFNNVGMTFHKDTYTVQSKEYRLSTRDAFNSPVPNEFGVAKDKLGDVLLVGARSNFLKKLGSDYSQALEAAGLLPDQVAAMAEEGICPSGYNVHHKKPIHGGGTNDAGNFVLIRDNLYHDMIHAHLDLQISGMKEGESREVMIAAPASNVVFFDNPKNLVTSDQNNDNINSGKVKIAESAAATKRNADYSNAVKDLSTDEITVLAGEITKLKTKIHKGNEGKFDHYNQVINVLNQEYCHRTDSKEVQSHITKSGDKVYFKKVEGKEPGIVFIHGTHGSMDGSKPEFIEEYCKKEGLSFLSMDLPGHKRSIPPEYKDCTISRWTSAAQELIEEHTKGQQMVIGASMGGWIALNVAAKMPDRVSEVVGLAAAPDYTERMQQELSPEQKNELYKKGMTKVYSDFSPTEGEELTRAVVVDGEKNMLLRSNSPEIKSKVVLIQGVKDNVVAFEEAKSFTKKLKTSTPVEMKTIKDAGHGLGRPQDLEVLKQVVDEGLSSFLGKQKAARPQVNYAVANKIKGLEM
ncbi:MAG: alpha/beta hydrolase [Alphaproteobacteria bacterium]